MTPLILASTSPYRRALLERFGLPFQVVRPDVTEEHRDNETPETRARRLAFAKAQAVAAQHPEALVIGSDQVAAGAGGVLDKPGNASVCRSQLGRLSGGTTSFYTACAVIGEGSGFRLEHVDITTVVFRALSEAEIDRYVSREQPFDCAGGFKVEALGITLFDRIDCTDPTALIGLPLIWLASALRQAGYSLP